MRWTRRYRAAASRAIAARLQALPSFAAARVVLRDASLSAANGTRGRWRWPRLPTARRWSCRASTARRGCSNCTPSATSSRRRARISRHSGAVVRRCRASTRRRSTGCWFRASRSVADGRRLGYGGGYYDRLMTTLRTRARRASPGAFDVQIVAHIPAAAHDLRVDVIVTESRILPAPGRAMTRGGAARRPHRGRRARRHAGDPDVHIAGGNRAGRARAGAGAGDGRRAAMDRRVRGPGLRGRDAGQPVRRPASSSAMAQSACRRSACCCARPESSSSESLPASLAGLLVARRHPDRSGLWADHAGVVPDPGADDAAVADGADVLDQADRRSGRRGAGGRAASRRGAGDGLARRRW